MYRIQFAYLSNDVYYSENEEESSDFSYYISWGTDLYNMTLPVKIENDDTDLNDPLKYGNHTWLQTDEDHIMKIYNIPAEYKAYQNQHRDKDIYVQTTIFDAVGNSNVLTTLVPGQIEFYNYTVSEGSAADKKKIKLSYYDLAGLGTGLSNITKIPDKDNAVLYRIYYGKIEDGMDESAIRTMELKRNTVKPFERDTGSAVPDSKEFEVEAGSKYIFYIQPNYNMHSLTNNNWCGQTFGLPYKLIVDTAASTTSGSITAPEFTCEKVSAKFNSGLFNISVTITNPQPGVKYIPCYSCGNDEAGNPVWSYFDSHTEQTFSFQVKNLLRAPFETAWRDPDYVKGTWGDADPHKWKSYDGKNSYFESVKNCRAAYGYPSLYAKVKVLAISEDGRTAESDVDVSSIFFGEDDDNIPPYQSPELSSHDSLLSFDGHTFKFDGIVMEDEGHMSPYFQYYYMPYDSAWGDNLSVATPAQIEGLPGGTAIYTSNCYKNDWESVHWGEAKYSLTMNIPMNGIPDGRYMIFAKASDTYGNFNYITLGKADIGTFINKLKASWKTTDSKIQIVSTLPIESTERFDRNMINIQGLDTSNGNWWDKYGWANELLPCTETTEGGKTVLRYETPTGPTAQIVDSYDKEHGTWTQKTEGLEIARWWYRITMQSFNQNSLEYDNDLKIVTKDGANRKYRRPYGDTDGDGQVTYDYIQNISKYDLFTEETVSNTVYLFIPFDDNYLDGIKSSFFPSSSTPRSNKCFIVNVISASRDLGRAPDEWERRGKLIYTHYYDPGDTSNYTQFNESVAADDMFNSNEKGLVYYVAVVHFADGSMALSKTYTMQGM